MLNQQRAKIEGNNRRYTRNNFSSIFFSVLHCTALYYKLPSNIFIKIVAAYFFYQLR